MEINTQTKLYGLIGKPVGHSFSPLMQNMYLQDQQINGIYLAWDIQEEQLQQTIEGLFSLGAQGINVTIPYKEKVIPYLLGVTQKAELCGAVNTLIRTDIGFLGDNTDGDGLLQSLNQELGWKADGKNIIILGAGGASKGVAISCALAGATNLYIINRNRTKGQVIAELVNEHTSCRAIALTWDELVTEIYRVADTIINTTPIGMLPNINEMPPINLAEINEQHTIVDIVYNPLETKLIQEAKEKGAKTCTGLGMLIHQGALAFEQWTGRRVETREVRKRLEEQLSKC